MIDPNKPCETCAFNCKGTGGAADEASNRLKGLLAAHSGFVFWCHHSRSGPEYDWKGDKLGPLSLPAGERRVCSGWKAMVARIYAPDGPMGFLRAETPQDAAILRRYQRSLGSQAMNLLDAFLSEKDDARKDLIRVQLKDACRAVFAK